MAALTSFTVLGGSRMIFKSLLLLVLSHDKINSPGQNNLISPVFTASRKL